MKNRGKTLLIMSLFATSLIIPLSACEYTQTDKPKEEECVVKEIKLSTTNLSLEVGDKDLIDIELVGSISGKDIKDTKLTFSYDKEIISFDERKWEVKALSQGNTELVVTSSNGISNKVSITVTKTVLITKLSSNFNRSKMLVGDKLKIDISYAPLDATNTDIKFTSSNRSVLTVDKEGQLEAISVGNSIITVSYAGSDDVDSLTFSITVTQDEGEVKNDVALSSISDAVENESKNIVSGNIKITTKQNSIEEETFTNEYKVFDDHIYNKVKKYDDSEITLYYGKDTEYIYTVEDGKKSFNKIEDNSYSSSSITEAKANEMISLPAFISDYYYSKYSYGIGTFVEDEVIEKVFLSSSNSKKTVVSSEDDSLTMELDVKDVTTFTQYSLIIEKDGENLKSISYSWNKYDIDYLDEEGNLMTDAVKKEYYSFEASLTSGTKEKEENPEIDYNDFYYRDFNVEFKTKNYGEDYGEASLTFNRGDTIVYNVTDFSPSTADGNLIDRIYVESVSDESVIVISENKMAFNAVGEGTCKVVIASKKVKKEYTLTVVIPKAQSFKLVDFSDTLKSNSSMKFYINYSPYGADNDFNVTLKDESKEFATLEVSKTQWYTYYILKAASDFNYDSKVVYLDITCESNPNLNCTKEVTIIKALSNQEIYDEITAGTYTDTYTAEEDNIYTGELNFLTGDDANKGTFKMYVEGNRLYDTVSFQYVINNNKVTVSNYNYANGYLSSFKVTFDDPTFKKIKVSVEDTYGDYEGEVYAFTLSK